MKIATTKIWAHITADERMALTLTLGSGKSTWEAGAIMKKSHYKFLEIASRGKMFIKLFTQHYDLYPDFWSPDLSINPIVKDYFDLVIRKRMVPHEAVKKLQHPVFSISSVRNRMIQAELDKWDGSKILSEIMFFNFVKEFDRWNNHRILPKDAQEPHGFKRRNKNALKLYMKQWGKLIHSWPTRYEKLKTLKKPKKNKNAGYFMLYPDYRAYVYEVIKCNKKSQVALKRLRKSRIFLFSTEEEAYQFGDMVAKYLAKGIRRSEEGLIFWPTARVFITKAINHDDIMGISPNRIINPKNPFTPNQRDDRKELKRFGIEI
jgi:hypothetical protein